MYIPWLSIASSSNKMNPFIARLTAFSHLNRSHQIPFVPLTDIFIAFLVGSPFSLLIVWTKYLLSFPFSPRLSSIPSIFAIIVPGVIAWSSAVNKASYVYSRSIKHHNTQEWTRNKALIQAHFNNKIFIIPVFGSYCCSKMPKHCSNYV